MAKMTRQFLKRKSRYRDYEMDPVTIEVFALPQSSAKAGGAVWLDLDGGYAKKQAISLSREDVRTLAAELLRCLDTDREVHAVLKQYFEEGRRARPAV